MKMNPARAKNTIVTEPLAAVKRRLRNSPTSSRGSEARRCQPMNAPNSAAAKARPTRVRAESQPRAGASMIV